MLKVTQLTASAKQNQNLVLEDGTSIFLELEYKPQQLGWFITRLRYANFEVLNIRVSTLPNILRQYKNVLPFGLACFTQGNGEPNLQEDFFSNRSELYVLTAEEVEQYEAFLNGV